MKKRPLGKWERLLLSAGRALDLRTPYADLPVGHFARRLWIEISIEADRHDDGFEDGVHRVLRRALGANRVRALRQAAFQGDPWDATDRFLLRRLALALCQNINRRVAHTLAQVDAMARCLLLTRAELEAAERDWTHQRQRQHLHQLHHQPPANRLPC